MPLPHQIIYFATVIALCGFTIWAGGWPERIGLSIVVAASAASFLAAQFVRSAWHAIMPMTFAIDVATCVAFFVLMVRSDRFWPIWGFGFCFAMVTGHVMRLVQHFVPAWSYYHTTGLWAYPVMASILIGAATTRRRRAIARS